MLERIEHCNGLDDRNGLGNRNGLDDRNGLGNRNGLDDRNGLGHHDPNICSSASSTTQHIVVWRCQLYLTPVSNIPHRDEDGALTPKLGTG